MERDNIVIFHGEQYIILELAINSVFADNGEVEIISSVLLTKVEPAVMAPRFRAIWTRLENITELVSSIDYRQSDWMIGVIKGYSNAN